MFELINEKTFITRLVLLFLTKVHFLICIFIQVKDQFVNEFPVFEDGTRGLWVKSSLEMDTDANSFRGGRLKLKCIASVYSRYKQVYEKQIEEEKPRSASVLGSKDSSSSSSSSGNQAGLNPSGELYNV